MTPLRSKTSVSTAVFASARVRCGFATESAERRTDFCHAYDADDVNCQSPFSYWQAHEAMPEAEKRAFHARMAATESAWMCNELDYDYVSNASESADSVECPVYASE